MKKRGLLALLLAVVMVFTFAACGTTPDATTSDAGANTDVSGEVKEEFKGAKTKLTDKGETEYVIVRNKKGSDYETEVAVDIKDKISKVGGADMKLSNDAKDPNAYEILIGSARGANEGLAENEWKVSHDGNTFVITGGSDKALEKAYNYFMYQFLDCDWFTTEFTTKDSIEVPKEFEHKDVYLTREEFYEVTKLIKYPEYPEEAISRDYDYSIKITQGSESIEIPVYNETVGSNYFVNNIKDGDIHRRYAEFAFSGDPVTIEVTANLDFESVAVMPSSKGIDFAVNGNVITYKIDKPQTTMIKLNNDKDSLLTIFAEYPEYEDDIPNRALETVHFYEAGFHEIEGGEIILGSNETLYLAPGAVVKARVKVSGMDVNICGRGTLLESSPNRTKSNKVNYMVEISNASRINLEGIKIVDAHCFNITLTSCSNVDIHDVKVLSNQISTDGLSWWAKNTDIHVYDCYWYISDDIFVVGGDCQGENLVENCIVGSDYGVFTPTVTGGQITFKNIDIFRCGRFIKVINKGGGAPTYLENIYAEDVPSFSTIVGYEDGGQSATRIYHLKNVSINGLADGKELITGSGNRDLEVTFDNVYVNGNAVTKSTNIGGKGVAKVEVTTGNKEDAKVGCNTEKKVTPYTTSKVFVGFEQVTPEIPLFTENGAPFVAVKEILKKLDFENIKLDGNKLTFSYGTQNYEVVAGEKGNLSAAPVIKDGAFCVPVDFFKTVLGTTAMYKGALNRLDITNIAREGNLLENGDMEEGMTPDWITRWFTPMYLSTDAHSGQYAMRTCVTPDDYEPGAANGIYQDIADVIRRYGIGQYKISAWVKKTPECDSKTIEMGVTAYYTPGKTCVKITPTEEWQLMEYTFTYSDNPEKLLMYYFYIGYADGQHKEFIIDDMKLEKIK